MRKITVLVFLVMMIVGASSVMGYDCTYCSAVEAKWNGQYDYPSNKYDLFSVECTVCDPSEIWCKPNAQPIGETGKVKFICTPTGDPCGPCDKIIPPPGVVPEFSIYGIIGAVVVIGAAVFWFVRKKKKIQEVKK